MMLGDIFDIDSYVEIGLSLEDEDDGLSPVCDSILFIIVIGASSKARGAISMQIQPS